MFGRPSADWLIVGLGNPGSKYEKTRHNAGFRAIGTLSALLSCRIDRGKFKALTGQASYKGQKLILLMPQTFMNLSGESVSQAAHFYKLPPERIIVLFDDISLDPGRLRVRAEGSAGGHNGLKSIIACLQSQNFPRVKIGVGAKPHPEYDLADWVLSSFSSEEERLLKPVLEKAAEAALSIVEDGCEKAAAKFNGK